MDRIGKYEILQELGRGATSTVYLGRDPFAEREVAIKVARPDILHDRERGKVYAHLFLNEAALVGRLNHPHIVQIYDAVVTEDLAYIVMEYVPGETLEAYCTPERLLPMEQVVEVAFKCTRALDYAAQQGITHRDIKPANILLPTGARFTDLKITDFGAAQVGCSDHTQISGVGSPAYTSPEQVREENLDLRTDIYSLGVVIYQLLTGQTPFQAESNYHMVYQILHGALAPPSSLRPGLPPVLDRIVMRALDRRREDRYPGWDEFARDLAQSLRKGQLHVTYEDVADSEKFDTLRSLPFFTAFPDAEIWEVVRSSRWQDLAPGDTVMREGEAGRFFCFLAAGELKVTKRGRILNLLTPGEVFGEIAALCRGDRRRSADVVALTPARIITVAATQLEAASASCRLHFYQAFMEVLAARLDLANERLTAE